MKRNLKFFWLIIFCLFMLITACKGTSPGESQPPPLEALSGETPLPTNPPTVAPTVTLIPSPTPTPIIHPAEVINNENISQLGELGRIGNGDYEAMRWSHDSQYVALGTGAGVFIMDREGELDFSHLDGWVNYRQLAFSHDNSLVAAGFSKMVWLQQGKNPNYVIIYALPSGEQMSVIDVGLKFQIEQFAFREDGSLVVVGTMLDEYYFSDYIAVIHFDPLTGERLGEY